MRFVTYASASGDDRVGLVDGDAVHGMEPGVSLLGLLEADDLLSAGDRARSNPTETVALEGLTLRAPLEPRSIRDSLGFLQHLRNCSAASGVEIDPRHSLFPTFYFSNIAAVVGPRDDVPIAPKSELFDYELEVAAVIGKPGANLAVDRAEEHIAGYMLLCDWSARDLQAEEMALRLGLAKGKDTANTLGPMLVTADELESYRSKKAFALEMTGYVNGELVSKGSWDDIDWGFPDMIAYGSRGTRIRPGDVFGSGTVATGCLYEHFAMDPENFRGWLQPGDEVRLVIEQLGEIQQRVVEGVKPEPLSSGY